MHRVFVLAVLVTAAACAKTVTLTPDVRQELSAESRNLEDLRLRVIGTFELHAGGRSTIVVKNYTETFGAAAPDDTTITLHVLGAQVAGRYDTLQLTFALAAGGGRTCTTPRNCAAEGGTVPYTLRQINGTWVGSSITIGGAAYQYHPCYQNVGSKCDDPLPATSREDRQVRVGVVQ